MCPLLSVLKRIGVDLLEQNEWERDSLLMGKNGAGGITWVLTRPVRLTTRRPLPEPTCIRISAAR